MGIIRLRKIRTYAYHGCLVEESVIGSDYLTDLEVKADLERASKTDALEDTVDYVLLNRIVKEEMGKPSKLLEHAARRILRRVFKECEAVTEITVSVSKINPPIGGDVKEVTVILSERR